MKKRTSRKMRSKKRKRRKEERREGTMKLRQQRQKKMRPVGLLWRWRQTWRKILMYQPPERKQRDVQR